MRDVDAAVPVYDIHTIDAVVDGFLASHRLALTLVAGFAVVTVLVAAIGLYGLTAQLVAQRVSHTCPHRSQNSTHACSDFRNSFIDLPRIDVDQCIEFCRSVQVELGRLRS